MDPLALSLARYVVEVEPLYWRKLPPTKHELSGNVIMVSTIPSNPVPILNVLSIVPLVLSRIIRFNEEPLYEVKPPPTNTFPSGCVAVA